MSAAFSYSPPPPTNAPFIEVQVAGLSLPVDGFSATIGAYGSIGHCMLKTDRSVLLDSGIDLFNAQTASSGPLPISISAGYSFEGRRLIFAGEFDDAKWDYKTGDVMLHGRDLAGQLVDQKFIITSAYANQTPDELVAAIAKLYGFTPVITPSPPGPNGQPQTVGSLMGLSGSYMTYPRPVWDILQSLARVVGYLLYVTPQGQIVYTPPQAGGTPLAFSWNTTPAKGVVPLMDLKPSYAPRRNKNFQVIVLSHHAQTAQITQGTVVVAGETVEIPGTKTIKAGTYVGAAASRVRSVASSSLEGLPVYVFRKEGLTAQQAQQLAESISADIAKHTFRIEGICDFLPGFQLLQPVVLQGQVDGFLARTLYVNSITNRYTMPAKGEHADAGLVTDFSALSIPPTSISDPSGIGDTA